MFDTYGKGNKPQIIALDHALYTIEIKNSDYITLQDLEIVNKGSVRLAGRTGVKLLCQDYGVSHRLILRGLYVHDVNGSLIKSKGGGSGIQIENKWRNKISIFDSLLIEDCVIRRTARNGIIWNAPYRRDNWHPNTHIVVRKNLLEGVPGDGIVPIGCDSALIEYNVMRDCPEILPSSEAAAGIWPWSCDNTLIQFNEVSGQKNQWDAQGLMQIIIVIIPRSSIITVTIIMVGWY
ncbi:right-handed parallel beta-helix repeat-containing protein [Arachidicoccus ginsenosidivorans]|uniref:right-handed parallel beta-helix repeat-containing protein n=1 Tax=Arachidicoccus ginsenosidivorans TaxID=496057 RepID=UPI001CEFA8A8|nr:right-handed parallel beta-helix repeat-containing protein [Arachidicoccus ginsenosidivorans]